MSLRFWRASKFRPKHFENYSEFRVIDKRKGMRAPLAQPIVPYAMDPLWCIGLVIIRCGCN